MAATAAGNEMKTIAQTPGWKEKRPEWRRSWEYGRCKAIAITSNKQCQNGVSISGAEFCAQHVNQEAGAAPISEEVWIENEVGAAHDIVATVLQSHGIKIIARASGWPDLLVKKNGKLVGVEVKRNSDSLRDNQRMVIQELRHIFPCYVVRIAGIKQEGEVSWNELLSSLDVSLAQPEFYGT
jgi:hypothetical protein